MGRSQKFAPHRPPFTTAFLLCLASSSKDLPLQFLLPTGTHQAGSTINWVRPLPLTAMELGIEAAQWTVSKALGTAAGGLLEAWADSTELGRNIEALRTELLYAEGVLNNARGGRGHEIRNPALTELLRKLQDQAYRADDIMDELEYFRVQDEIDVTYHTFEEHGGGCLSNHIQNAHHIARNIRKMIGCSSHGHASHNELDEEDTKSRSSRGASCGAWPCLGHKTSPDDEEQENEEDANQGVLCGRAIWPRARASSTPLPNQGDQEVENGCMARIRSCAHGTINTVSKQLPCHSVSHIQDPTSSNIPLTRHGFLCCGRPNKTPQGQRVMQAPRPKFDRVEMSRKMKEIIEQLKPLCAKVSTILNLELLDSSCSIAQCIGNSLDTWLSKKQWPTTLHKDAMMSRPVTTPEFSETQLYGRENEKTGIIGDICEGKYSEKVITVLPIVGPGGIGKTTLIQHIYKDLENHFEVKLWVCVSVSFDVSRLKYEIANKLKKDTKDDPDKIIEEQLKSKRFLLVLDDMWNCSNVDEWERFLVPFKKGQTKGSVILVTTRFPILAQMVKTTDHWTELKGLEEEEFKNLFKACVFGDMELQVKHKELLDPIGYEIVKKLKGSPLAAKTVGRLLRNYLDSRHWTRVLDSKEWESQNAENDIMPALKLSFDYLPFHLQQCFTYCTLFPEDYTFHEEKLIHFWIGLDLLHSLGENKSMEEIGRSYLTELVNHGFFKMEESEWEGTYYIIHDLLHELAVKLSADECLRICSPNTVRSIQISPSTRHLSIIIDESSIKDRKTFGICKEDFSVLGNRLKVENLRSLMLFGKQHGSFLKSFRGLLREAKALRLIFISEGEYRMEDLFPNFLNLVHLRYLHIDNNSRIRRQSPKNISRFYNLRVLDLQGCYWASFPDYFPRHMSNLLKLRHFVVPDDCMHAGICEVGRLKSLRGLERFEVGIEGKGFELRQIGHLLELRESLRIDSLEKVERIEEAEAAKLMHKKHLHKLILAWKPGRSNVDPGREEQVLEGLKPHNNLLELSIIGHGGSRCPSWLAGPNLSVKNLKSLCLDDVAWETFPPIGELRLVDKGAEENSSNMPCQHFKDLERIEFKKLAKLERLVIGSSSEMFSKLKVLRIEGCPELVELSFSNSATCSDDQQEQKTRFPELRDLTIRSCPKLLSLPPVRWTSDPFSFSISRVGGLSFLMWPWLSKVCLRIGGDEHAVDMVAASFWSYQ